MAVKRTIRLDQLALALLLSQSAGVIGSISTFPSIQNWYPTLSKPSFTPPDWIFAPVWIILYFLLGVASYLVWKQGFPARKVKEALKLYVIQLTLSALWPLIFFGLRSPLLGAIEILFYWTAIIFTISKFWNISRIAALLLIPYLAWVSFAAILNFSVYILNP